MECLRLSDEYKELKGGVLVTGAWVRPELHERVEEIEELHLWDQARCHLYGSLARNYVRLRIGDYGRADRVLAVQDMQTIVTRNFVERGTGCYGLFNQYEIDIFYEGTRRFTLDSLSCILEELRKRQIIQHFHLDRLTIHAAKGFTADFPLKVVDEVKRNHRRFIGIRCHPSDLYDYTNPWFPSFMEVGIH